MTALYQIAVATAEKMTWVGQVLDQIASENSFVGFCRNVRLGFTDVDVEAITASFLYVP